jgi:modulator of FtsH protease HflK
MRLPDMAWNEPGGSKDRDPWGGRGGGDQGPPDLDEALRKLQSQLAGIFGGRGGSGGGAGGGSMIDRRLFGLGLIAVAAIWGFSGFYQVDEGERAVVFRFGKLQEAVVQPGLHWYPRFVDSITTINVTRVNSEEHQALMLTEDENIVDVTLTVQYVIDNVQDYVVKVRDPNISLVHATESALRHVVGSAKMDQVITEGRAAIAAEVQTRLQTYLNNYGTGILISKVNIDKSEPPKQVVDAFNDVQRAKEDEARLINEAKAYGEGVIPEARGEAQKQIQQATAYREQVVARAEGETQRFSKLLTEYRQAKQVTRDRLYIDAVESVLSNTSKVLVDVEGGNNMLYLPLDRIVQQTAAPTDESLSSVAESIVRNSADRASTERRTSR